MYTLSVDFKTIQALLAFIDYGIPHMYLNTDEGKLVQVFREQLRKIEFTVEGV